ncbi:hypothetical protein QQS21_000259 [Conoideocrella luteorostrata]|uniref:Cytochrome P450 monooxygenase GliC2 n=1 Tax=Conoideocrella luteorostrata TaxID=1105319 RepID=A0AAJ0G2Y3_9HYPO|nr:hypothetical protein QQS21_000259 [Conoideocrella luteorostrata]
MDSAQYTALNWLVLLISRPYVNVAIRLALAALVLKFAWRVIAPNALKVISTVLNAYLSLVHRITSTDGKKSISGPAYSFPNGQMVDKFLAARARSWEWEKKYGKTYRIWAGSIPEIVITDPKDVELLYQQSTDHNKAPQANAGWLLTQILGSGLGLINGARWTVLRKTLDQMFSHRTALQYFRDSLDSSAEDYLAGISQFASADKQAADGKSIVINATQALQRYPFFEVASMFFGEMSAGEKERLWDLGRRYSEVFKAIVSGGIHRSKMTKHFNTKAWKDARDYQRAWKDFNWEMYRARKTTAPDTPIVILTEAAENGELTHDEVTDTIAESTFANLDIVTHVISSCVILLADAPSVQDDLLVEINETTEDRQSYIARKDTLLHYCLLESLRLQPVLSFTFPENPPREKVLGTYIIPKDTTVIVDAFAINIRNPFWGPDNRAYRPSRFANIKQSQLRYNLATFGYGPRKCLGQHIADKIIKSVAYYMFSQYRVSLQPMQAIEGAFKVDKTSWVAMYDVDLKLEPRDMSREKNMS